MDKEAIRFDDFYRILMGKVPMIFYIELIIRALFVYLALTFGMRLMGKKLSSELSLSELAALSTLAAATGLIILAPERGLIPPLIVIAVVLAIKWLTHLIGSNSAYWERKFEGRFSALIVDGTIDLDELKHTRISKEQLFAQLRQEQVIHLGEVQRFYLEANGSFSLVKRERKKPGLPVIPEWDQAFIDEHDKSAQKVCGNCGHLQADNQPQCDACSKTCWRKALV